jgi:hypothetical protein
MNLGMLEDSELRHLLDRPDDGIVLATLLGRMGRCSQTAKLVVCICGRLPKLSDHDLGEVGLEIDSRTILLLPHARCCSDPVYLGSVVSYISQKSVWRGEHGDNQSAVKCPETSTTLKCSPLRFVLGRFVKFGCTSHSAAGVCTVNYWSNGHQSPNARGTSASAGARTCENQDRARVRTKSSLSLTVWYEDTRGCTNTSSTVTVQPSSSFPKQRAGR